jgi:superfamily II DNA or RNA helicase
MERFIKAKVLGVTATPNRGDHKTLAEVYDKISCELHLKDLIRDGYLSPISILQAPVNIDISGVRKDASGDLSSSQLGEVIEPHLDALADLWIENAKGRKTVMFLPLVSVSQHMAEVFKRRGIRAVHVDGNDRDGLGQDWDIITNAQLLSTGWDCPEISCVYLGRPTQSQSLYAQMIGRGTRICEGKDNLLVLDPVWASDRLAKSLASPARLVATNDEDCEEMEARMTAGQPVDLIDLEDEVESDKASGLLEALRRNKTKSKKVFNPLDYAAMTEDVTIAQYQPRMAWENQKPTAKQIESLAKLGFDVSTIETKGQASILLDSAYGRINSGMATPKQIKYLLKAKVQNAHKLTMQAASERISQIISERQSWRKR